MGWFEDVTDRRSREASPGRGPGPLPGQEQCQPVLRYGVSARRLVSYAWLAGRNVRPTAKRKTGRKKESSVECPQEARQEATSQQTPAR